MARRGLLLWKLLLVAWQIHIVAADDKLALQSSLNSYAVLFG